MTNLFRSLIQENSPDSRCQSFFNIARNLSDHSYDRPPAALLSCAPFVSSNVLNAKLSPCAPRISTEPENLSLCQGSIKKFSRTLHCKAPITCRMNDAVFVHIVTLAKTHLFDELPGTPFSNRKLDTFSQMKKLGHVEDTTVPFPKLQALEVFPLKTLPE